MLAVILLTLLAALPPLELAGDGGGDDPRSPHAHASPALASTHDPLPQLALIVPRPGTERLEHVSTAGRRLFVPPRR